MKANSLLLVLLIISGCSNQPAKEVGEEVTAIKNRPVCKTLLSSYRNLPTNYSVCVQRSMFQPTKFHFYENKELIFEGSDYKKTATIFKRKVNDVTTYWICDELVTIVSGDIMNILSYEKIPKNVTSECGVKSENDGSHKPFIRQEECKKSLGAFKLANVGARCSVIKNRTTVYRYDFMVDPSVYRYAR
jgi:hypothetical protein